MDHDQDHEHDVQEELCEFKMEYDGGDASNKAKTYMYDVRDHLKYHNLRSNF